MRQNYDRNELYWYWFVNLKGIGLKTRRRLLEIFGHPRYLYQADESELSGMLKPDQLAYCIRSRNMDTVIRSRSRLSAEDTAFIHWESPEYPPRLRELPDPPYGLYLRGRLPDPDRPAVAMIGSRKATGYGIRIAEMFAKELAAHGVQIISGLAEGIDTAGHTGVLRGHGYTLGVLGGGIDSIYPRANFNLYMEMYRVGGVLSEWNLGTVNHAGLFPLRNRLISGLSDAVFVLEAGKRSGTFITVDQALEQGRTVFALPGRITDANSAGTNQLISDGAIPVMQVEDILAGLELSGYDFSGANSGTGSVNAARRKRDIIGPPEIVFPSRTHEKIFSLIDEKDPVDFDRLMEISGCQMQDLCHILFDLEVGGLIIQPNQNIYLKKLNHT